MNGVICSLYKLVFHFTDGTNQEIQNSDWKGFEGINLLIKKYHSAQQEIQSLKNTTDVCENNNQLKNFCDYYEGVVKNLKNVTGDNFISNLVNSQEKISSISKTFKDIKSKTFDDIEKIKFFTFLTYHISSYSSIIPPRTFHFVPLFLL